jgi:cholesterol oxidase
MVILLLKELAKELGREDQFEHPDVLFFGKEGQKSKKDPYSFDGKGQIAGMYFLRGCNICRHNAKKTL